MFLAFWEIHAKLWLTENIRGKRRILLVKAGNEIRSTESAKHRQSCVC